MDEREKIINAIEETEDIWHEVDRMPFSDEYHEIKHGALADALIAAGIGDITEWKERAEEMRLANAERKEAAKECLLILYKHVDCCPTDAFSRGWNEAINTAFKEISETYGVSVEDEE